VTYIFLRKVFFFFSCDKHVDCYTLTTVCRLTLFTQFFPVVFICTQEGFVLDSYASLFCLYGNSQGCPLPYVIFCLFWLFCHSLFCYSFLHSILNLWQSTRGPLVAVMVFFSLIFFSLIFVTYGIFTGVSLVAIVFFFHFSFSSPFCCFLQSTRGCCLPYKYSLFFHFSFSSLFCCLLWHIQRSFFPSVFFSLSNTKVMAKWEG